MKRYIIVFFFLQLLVSQTGVFSDNVNENIPSVNNKKKVLQINLRNNINSSTWVLVQKGFKKAVSDNYDCVLINMNTYGGEVVYADSIRSTILNAPFPVFVFVDFNAASAGALISIACDSIYMKTGSTIGASTVVDQQGAAAPDKYQSYMRGIIRATAESQGKHKLIKDGDTIEVWRRDPAIAEAMVDPDIYIKGVIDSGKVLTFTAYEAFKNGYCEAIASDIEEVLHDKVGYDNYDLVIFKLKGVDKLKGSLMGTALRAILIMLIIAGIWFELQAPGIGFPTLAALAAATLYFAPLYIDGLAQNWEIIIFVIGLVLLALEIFVIPGFGVAGITGSLCVISGLTFALIDNDTFKFTFNGLNSISEPLLLVTVSITIALTISILITNKIGKGNGIFQKMALISTQDKENGFIGVPVENIEMVGKTGIASTILRPSGKINIDGKTYDAVSEIGYIESGEKIKVVRYESGQLYVIKDI